MRLAKLMNKRILCIKHSPLLADEAGYTVWSSEISYFLWSLKTIASRPGAPNMKIMIVQRVLSRVILKSARSANSAVNR